jgi:4'-phosphopantetheinyl transferase
MSNVKLLWSLPTNQRQLDNNNVHVWAVDLNKSTERIFSLHQTLSSDEQDRAGRFHFERDRNRFIAGRGILREILGSYLETTPSQLQFIYNPQGKPALTSFPERPLLHFNLTRSQDLALIAVTRACAVGIDVEWIHPINDAENIAARFFSPREAAELAAIPNGQREAAFYNLWTRKEAFLKATGEGITEKLGQIEVSFLPEQPAQIRSISGDSRAAADWTLTGFTPAPGYVAAVAAQAQGLKLSCWQWPR